MKQNPAILLRPAQPADCTRLARVLRPADRAELAASHPGQAPAELLEQFVRRSAYAYVLTYHQCPAALFGLAPDGWLGNCACVWLLTGYPVAQIPKTFFRTARRFVAAALLEYAQLYNFADERYAAALRFIRRLGGTFDGAFYQTPAARFLRFTFRRK